MLPTRAVVELDGKRLHPAQDLFLAARRPSWTEEVARDGADEHVGTLVAGGRGRVGIGREIVFHLLHVAVEFRAGVAAGRGRELEVARQARTARAAAVGRAALERRGDGAAGNQRVLEIGADDRLHPLPQTRIAHAFRGGVAQVDRVNENPVNRREDQRRAHGGEQNFDQREGGGARP